MTEPREVFVLDELAVIHAAKVVVQCGAQLAPPDDENPDGIMCGNLIESELVQIPVEPGMAAEFGVECPACSKIISQREGRQLQAIVPLAVLAGDQVKDVLEPIEADENDPDEEDAEAELLTVGVEITPEDQGA